MPAAALHLDAVRLMTVHGSKGLEFEAVHVQGLTVASFPSSNRGHRCPPPTGMIDSAGNISPVDEAKRAHDDEEECLFFVATRAPARICGSIMHVSNETGTGARHHHSRGCPRHLSRKSRSRKCSPFH